MRTKKFTFLRPGMRPQQYVVDRLKRYHPSVRIVWNYRLERWQLIERDLINGRWQPILVIQDWDGGYQRPSLSNTVHRLNQIDVRNLSYWEREQRLRNMDEPADAAHQAEIENRMSDFSRELHGRLQKALGIRVSVAKPNVPDGQRAGIESP